MQGKAPKEIHAILTETLACFLPVRAKDLSAPLYKPAFDNLGPYTLKQIRDFLKVAALNEKHGFFLGHP